MTATITGSGTYTAEALFSLYGDAVRPGPAPAADTELRAAKPLVRNHDGVRERPARGIPNRPDGRPYPRPRAR
ncbi:MULTISPECIES: hypothetical protein [Streptomyces]|uniref:Uncharacterized protein n=2 Tax=Streptomyces TaxID=1883 RepID=A0A3S9PRG1_STRLT|nr:hypothetical protein [Streptomyces luteoverticillatus]AZQ74904.1 hypothetical protein EKH77_30200 [Streptomyces luteoverticillatus]